MEKVEEIILNSLKDGSFYKLDDQQFSNNDSALIRCLKFGCFDEKLFETWFSKEMNCKLDDAKVLDKIELVKTLREKLKNISANDKNCIIKYLARLLSAKFSGSKQSDNAISLVLDKLIYSVTNKKPIIFIFGFGGYKNYNSPSFPEVDFSELFHFKYMTQFLLPIINDYKYGVVFEYESEEISIQFNNVPQETTDKYTRSFKKLLDFYVENVRKQNNLKLDFKFVIARNMYDEKDLYKKMNDYYTDMKKVVDELDLQEKEVWIKRARTNFLINGTKDYSNLSEQEIDALVIDARIKNECFLAADYDLRIDFWERPNAISLFGTWGKTPCASPTDGGLHLKSTKFSNTDFWIGTGIFAVNSNTLDVQEQIYSKSQLQTLENKISSFNFDGDLAKISKNFEKIHYVLL